METFKPMRSTGGYYIFGMILLYNSLFVLGILKLNSYILSTLIKISLVMFTLYLLYYILTYYSLRYCADSKKICIHTFFKNIVIPYEEIDNFKFAAGSITGVKLSGVGSNSFALGKSVIKKIGTTNMFVTSNAKIVYLKVGELNYALTPADTDKFINVLLNKNIHEGDWEQHQSKHISLYRERGFMLPFLLASLVITILTLNPFILYLSNRLPASMPLNFDAAFFPVDQGTGKQFAFNQMIYGVLNMAILFCMYYASHFYAKYDKKSAKKFIYISLIIAIAFLIIQFRILHTFR